MTGSVRVVDGSGSTWTRPRNRRTGYSAALPRKGRPDPTAPLTLEAVFQDRKGGPRVERIDCRPQLWRRLEYQGGQLIERRWSLVEMDSQGRPVYIEHPPSAYQRRTRPASQDDPLASE